MSRLAALCVSNAVWRAVKDHIWPKAHNFWCYVCDLTRLLVSRDSRLASYTGGWLQTKREAGWRETCIN